MNPALVASATSAHHASLMAILRERTVWKAPRPANETRRSTDLTPEEQSNARAAIRFLAKRHGTLAKLAAAMRTKHGTLQSAVKEREVISAGIALRAARVAGVPLEDVLSGVWPPVGACPHCGRGPVNSSSFLDVSTEAR